MKHLDALINRTPALAVCRADLEAAVQTLETMHKAGGKLLLCGNGGSAADCGHISGELLKSFLLPRPVADGRLDAATRAVLQEGVAAIPLPAFSTLISAFANDVNADFVYAQLVYVLGREGDVLLCLSTSGNAKNVLHAASAARARGMQVIGLSGGNGGALRSLCDLCICVPATETYRVQEKHLPLYHQLCIQIEASMFPENKG